MGSQIQIHIHPKHLNLNKSLKVWNFLENIKITGPEFSFLSIGFIIFIAISLFHFIQEVKATLKTTSLQNSSLLSNDRYLNNLKKKSKYWS